MPSRNIVIVIAANGLTSAGVDRSASATCEFLGEVELCDFSCRCWCSLVLGAILFGCVSLVMSSDSASGRELREIERD